MSFRPAESSKKIVEFYKDYILTTFKTSNDEYNKQLEDILNKKELISKGPYISLTDSFEKGESINDLVEQGILCKEISKFSELNPERKLYKHQAEAIKKSKENNLIVTTGTGSGKTECFLIPLINQLLEEYENNTLNSGVRTLIVYPMNALVNDQIRRLREIFSNYDGKAKITYGRFTGETEETYSKAKNKFFDMEGIYPSENELISREQMRENPPNILITNYAMLEYLLLRPGDGIFFNGENAYKWKNIILDEAHTYTGAKGIEVSNLIKRIKAMLNRRDIKFILTSATLGDEDSNKSIINFGESLCSAKFTEKSIIRASRAVPTIEGQESIINFEIYKQLAKMIRDNENSFEILEFLEKNNFKTSNESDEDERLRHTLYSIISNDKFYINVRENLLNNVKTLDKVCEQLDVSQDEFTDFITVASNASFMGDKIFDAKYHMFIAGIEGIYLTLNPSNKLFIKKLETYKEKPFNKDDDSYKVYKASFCKDCKAIYIIAQEEKTQGGGYLVQKNKNDKDYKPNIYLFEGNYSEEDEDIDAKTYIVCSKCGAIKRKTSFNRLLCGHDEENYNYLIKVKDSQDKLHKCPCCHALNTHTSIVRERSLGNDAATAVIATGLYKELPKSRVIKEIKEIEEDEFGFSEIFEEEIKEHLSKQFLVFSDNRQEAAFFSSYLQNTYNNTILKRLMVEIINENTDSMKKGVSIDFFVDRLKEQFIEYGIYKEEYCEREAWLSVIKELLYSKSDNSLQSKGLLYFDYNIGNFNENRKLGLSGGEVQALFKIFVNEFLDRSAITFPIDIKKSEKDKLFFNGVQLGFELTPNNDEYTESWLPKTDNGNKRTKLLQKYFVDMDHNTIFNLLKSIYNKLLTSKFLKLDLADKNYKFDSKYINIKSVEKLYICDECKTITPFNLKNICPNYRCNGTLRELNIQEVYKNDHYRKNYENLDIYPMVVKEHTAQLASSKAYEYQNKFKNKEINVLSCSTTFEMGVDLGSLETVFMRNIPPSPANYAQRAGRAGRSLYSEAYALTFCPNRSHDMHYFRHPEEMINGSINPPSFNVENDKIVLRHIFASAFSLFFKSHNSAYKKTIGEFLEYQSDVAFKGYIQSKPQQLKQYLKDILSAKLQLEFSIDDFGWTKYLLSEDEREPGYLTIALNKYWDELNVLNKSSEKVKRESANAEAGSNEITKSSRKLIKINESIKTLKNEQLISFLSSNNLIPKYGFPIDTVELKTLSNGGMSGNLRLNRDLSNAISEYAPGSEIVADGKIIQSRYIRRLEGHSWPRYNFSICPQCNTLNRVSWASGKIKECKHCGFELPKNQGEYIIPKFGFLMDNKTFSDVGIEKPIRTYRGEISYLGDETKIDFKKFDICGNEVLIGNSKMDSLLILNNSKFYICEECGYGIIDNTKNVPTISEKHRNPNDYPCSNNKLNQLSLGHEFKTDVIYIKFKDEDICGANIGKAWTILYSLLEGLSLYLEVDRNELSGCLHGYGEDLGFVLFDNTPGGAGYVKQLKDEKSFIGMLENSYKVVSECTCGGEEGDTVCYSCLCNYYNQSRHSIMKRRFAIEFFDRLKNNQKKWTINECIEVQSANI